jgi:hypothetical protein
MVRVLAAGLLAGGTGVTAMVNLATVILKNPADKVKVRAHHLLNKHTASVCWRETACDLAQTSNPLKATRG